MYLIEIFFGCPVSVVFALFVSLPTFVPLQQKKLIKCKIYILKQKTNRNKKHKNLQINSFL